MSATTRSLIVNMAVNDQPLPQGKVFSGYRFTLTQQVEGWTPNQPAPAVRTAVTTEPNVMFVDLLVGTKWKVSCQAIGADSIGFGPSIEADVVITPVEIDPGVSTYPAPVGLSFMLD